MKRAYNFGTVSHATMRAEDLIPAFLAELRSGPLKREHRKTCTEIANRLGKRKYWDSGDVEWDLEALFDLLDVYAAPYFYFGAHPGDGSDYGYWLVEDFHQEFDGLKVSDLSEIPSDYYGYVLVVNDHGNMTLYIRQRRRGLREVWGLV